jgi:hypothetical protein
LESADHAEGTIGSLRHYTNAAERFHMDIPGKGFHPYSFRFVSAVQPVIFSRGRKPSNITVPWKRRLNRGNMYEVHRPDYPESFRVFELNRLVPIDYTVPWRS